MPTKPDITIGAGPVKYESATGIDRERWKEAIIAVFYEDRLDLNNGLTLSDIASKSDVPWSFDTLRVYLGQWDNDFSLAIEDFVGLMWVVVPHRQHTKALMRRKAVLSLNQSVISKRRGKEIATPFIDRMGLKGKSVLSELLQKDGNWTFFNFLQKLINTYPASSAERFELIRQSVIQLPKHDVDQQFDQPGLVTMIRMSVLASLINIFFILEEYGIADKSDALQRVAKFQVDPRWIPLMPAIKELIALCETAGIPIEAYLWLILYEKLLFKQSVTINDRTLEVLSVKTTE